VDGPATIIVVAILADGGRAYNTHAVVRSKAEFAVV